MLWGKTIKGQKYGSAIHARSFSDEKEQERKGFSPGIYAMGGSFAAQTYFGEESVKGFIQDHLSTDGLYKTIRRQEARLPIFRIPLRASQFGDVISPFTSSASTNWTYDLHEVFDKSGSLRKEFEEWLTPNVMKEAAKNWGFERDKEFYNQFLKQQDISTTFKTNAFDAQGNRKKGFDRFSFEKNGKAYGTIYGISDYFDEAGNKQQAKFTLKDNVFLMERPTTKGGQFSYFYEAAKRQTHIKEALGENHWLVSGLRKNFNISDETALKVRRFGGLVKGIGGSFLTEHVNAMNRFLKEPVPFLNKVLDLEVRTGQNLENVLHKQMFGSMGDLGTLLGSFVQTSHLQVPQMEELGRLPRFLRPYVSSDYWTKTPLRMLTALSAKGAMYIKGVPTALMAASYTRRKMTEFDSSIGGRVASGGLFALGGLGVGSLVKSGYMRSGLTKTQALGAGLGLAIGILPQFDKGLGAGFGALYSKTRIISANAWSLVGGQDSVKRQEDLFQGITHPATAFGFGMFGGMIGFINKEIGTNKKLAGLDELFKDEKFTKKVTPFIDEIFNKDVLDSLFNISKEEISETGSTLGRIKEKLAGFKSEQFISDVQAFEIGKNGSPNISSLIEMAAERGSAKGSKVYGQPLSISNQLLGLAIEYGKQEPLGTVFQTREASRILREGMSETPKSFTGVLAGIVNEFTKRNPDAGLSQRIRTEGGFEELSSKLQVISDEIINLQYALSESTRIESSGYSAGRRVFEKAKSIWKSPNPSFTRGFLKGVTAFTGISVAAAAIANVGSGSLNPVGLLPGWMIRLTGGGQSAKETKEIFTGEKEVGIRKGRWWLLGTSPWEGTKTQYHRMHSAVLAQSDAEDNALYGSFDEKVEYDPILHPFKFLMSDDFKYHREERLSYMSPTPLTGEVFKDIPLFGDILSATVGQVLKPQKAIRANEWMAGGSPGIGIDGSMTQVQAPSGFFDFHDMRDAPPIPELGGASDVYARDNLTIESVFRRTASRLSEQAGLRGFLLKNYSSVLGYSDKDYVPTIESADSLHSAQRSFWHMNLGDPSYTEFIRRYLNKDRNNYYNPLSNMAPSWLPENDFYIDFKHGNYYNKVEKGEIRLPGVGYETLNPELRGLHPENYSLGHKYKILSDVAYGSDEWKFTKERVIQSLQAGKLSGRDQKLVATANEHLEERSLKKAFREYKFDEKLTQDVSLTISGVFDDGTFTAKEYGKRRLSLGGLNMSMSALVRKQMEEYNISTVEGAETAALQAQKRINAELRNNLTIGKRITARVSSLDSEFFDGDSSKVYIDSLYSKISKYAEIDSEDQFYGLNNYSKSQRFFGNLWDKFTHTAVDLPLSPALALNKILPFQSQAKFIQRLTPIELYAKTRVYGKELQLWEDYNNSFIQPVINETKSRIFGDFVPKKVQYARMMNEYFDKVEWLKNFSLEQAALKEGNKGAAYHYGKKKRQTLFGADPYKGFTDIWKALPSNERDFYKEFVSETDPEKQQRILELVPENLKKIYIAQWQNKEITALRKKAESGLASSQEQKDLMALYNLRRLEGMNYNSELEREYRGETNKDIEYADWMRMKMLTDFFQSHKMPSINFVGFDPRVSMDDVKYKVAKNEGIDTHDISQWENKEATMPMKNSYVSRGAKDVKGWYDDSGMSASEIELAIRKIMGNAHGKISLTPLPPGSNNKIIVSGKDSREQEIKQKLRIGGFF